MEYSIDWLTFMYLIKNYYFIQKSFILPRSHYDYLKSYMVFGETIPTIFDHSKWFENGLTLQILRWYKWLRFKDIVWGFGKLKKIVEKIKIE